MKPTHRLAVAALAVAAILAAAGVSAAPPPQTLPPGRSLDPPGGVLVAPGSAPDLIFLYTGDVIGYVDPCG